MHNGTCGLNKLLASNGVESKTASGLQAIKWAEEGNWEKLEEYCLDDAILTHKISVMPEVILPLTGKTHVKCFYDHKTMEMRHGACV